MRSRVAGAVWLVVVLLEGRGGSGSSANFPKPPAATSPDTTDHALVPSPAKLNGEPGALGRSWYQRANTYRLYASHGKEQWLRLNFNAAQYEVLDDEGHSTSGTFEQDFTEPGTYIFQGARIASAISVARFRVLDGAIVGTFPLASPFTSGSSYEVMPFIAARDFIDVADGIDGAYNLMSLVANATGPSDARFGSLRIDGSSRSMRVCASEALVAIENCGAHNLRQYGLSFDGDRWLATSTADPNDRFAFRVALIEGEKVYLSARAPRTAEARELRIGLSARAIERPTEQAYGGSTDGRWVITHQLALHSGGGALGDMRVNGDGVYASRGFGASPIPGVQGAWAREANPGAVPGVDSVSPGYMMRNEALFVHLGQQGTEGQGELVIAAVQHGSAPVLDNGLYKVFAANGTQQWLWLHFETWRYRMVDDTGGQTIDGSFSADAIDGRTYAFHVPGAATAEPGARFRIAAGPSIVGGFPFTAPFGTAGTKTVQPFFAVRTFVTRQPDLATTYTLRELGIVRKADSNAAVVSNAFRIQNNGTEWTQCDPAEPILFDHCVSQHAYSIEAGRRSGEWLLRALGQSAASAQSVYVAIAGTSPVIVKTSGAPLDTEPTATLTIATASGPGTGVAGPTMPSAWSLLDFSNNQFTQYIRRADGTTSQRTLIRSAVASVPAGFVDYEDATNTRLRVLPGFPTVMVDTGPDDFGALHLALP